MGALQDGEVADSFEVRVLTEDFGSQERLLKLLCQLEAVKHLAWRSAASG